MSRFLEPYKNPENTNELLPAGESFQRLEVGQGRPDIEPVAVDQIAEKSFLSAQHVKGRREVELALAVQVPADMVFENLKNRRADNVKPENGQILVLGQTVLIDCSYLLSRIATLFSRSKSSTKDLLFLYQRRRALLP